MTILVVSENFPPRTGGSGRWMWELYRRFPRGEVVVAAGEHPDAAQFDANQELKILRVPLAFRTWGLISPAGMRGYGKAVRIVRTLVKSWRATQIHCGCILPEGWIAWTLRKFGGPPYVCYVHGEELNIVSTSKELRWMSRRVLASAQLVVANSVNTSRLLSEQWRVSSNRLRVLHPGVDASLFRPAEQNESIRQSLGWSGRTVVLTVGRLQKRKGQDMLIRVLPRIAAVVPDVLYSIVGDGDERKALEQLAADCGVSDRVQFVGEVGDEQLLRCYQQCQLFVLPNRTINGDFEGFGMVLVEAQACGKPVLAGCSGGTAETMCDPHTGKIVNAADASNLAVTVIELLKDERVRHQMGSAARVWAEEQYDWESLTHKALYAATGLPLAMASQMLMPNVSYSLRWNRLCKALTFS